MTRRPAKTTSPARASGYLSSVIASLFCVACLASQTFAQRNLTDIPVPDPEEELRSFIVADGFEVNLFAADPMLAKPIQMNFDAQGRLWIASSEVYPQIEPGQQASDKIIVIEDTDRDGVADKTEVFVDGLLIPTGVVPGDGGCYVANSTELLHFSDTDGDGAADFTRRVLSGFGTEDTHHLLHTLRWGPDGMLYMNQSIYIHSHIETPYGVRHLNGGGIWQFRPESMELEVFSRGFVNSWGHHFDRYGQSFATDGAYGEGINYVFPGAVFVTAVNAKRVLSGLNPGSPKHCGLEIVSGAHLPDDWQGNMLTNDFRANRVCRFVVSESGAGYASRQEVELIKTRNVAFRPIDVKMGPDGAIYVADWYNPIIQHGEVDFRDPRRDHTHGRIWRITKKDRPLVERPTIVGASPEELVKLLERQEDWIRLHAKLEMKQQPLVYMQPAIMNWVSDLHRHDAETDQLRLEALWSLQAIGAVDESLLNLLLHSVDHRVRAAATRVAVATLDDPAKLLPILTQLVEDDHPQVRLEAVRGLAQIPTAEAAGTAARALDHPIDRFLDFAIWQTMRDLAPHWLPAVEAGGAVFSDPDRHTLFALAALDSPVIVPSLLRLLDNQSESGDEFDRMLQLLATHGGPGDLRVVLDRALSARADSPDRCAQILDSLQQTCRQQGGKRPSGEMTSLLTLLADSDQSVRLAASRCVGTWRLGAGRPTLVQWCTGEIDIDLASRIAAIDSLALFEDAATRDFLLEFQKGDHEPPIQARVIRALAFRYPVDASQALMALMHDQERLERVDEMVNAILANKDGRTSLAEALQDVSLSSDNALALKRAIQQANVQADQLLELVSRAGNLEENSWDSSPELVERIVRLVAETGDPARGEAVYRRANLQCLKCHAIAGSGGEVGPDLVSIGASAPVDYLLESLIDPNAKIKENFHSKTVITLDGQTVTGIPVSQADGVLTLRVAEGNTVEIREVDIEEMVDGRSLMVEGLVDVLEEQELVDLVRFLSELGKVGDYSVGNRSFVRDWDSLVWTNEANRRLNRTSYDTAANDDDAFTWKAEYSQVAGSLPTQHLAPFVIHRGLDPTSFLRFHFQVDQPGEVTLSFNSIEGLDMWVDGKPTRIDANWTAEFEQGVHRVSFAVNQNDRSEPLQVEVRPGEGSTAQVTLQID